MAGAMAVILSPQNDFAPASVLLILLSICSSPQNAAFESDKAKAGR